MIEFILGILICLNLIMIIGYIFIYKKVLKNNPLSKITNIDKEFWNL